MSRLTNGDRERDRRIIVIVPHEPGSLAKVREALGEAKINIDSVDELGTISLQIGDDDAALQALLKAGLRAVTSDASVVPLRDRPGALAARRGYSTLGQPAGKCAYHPYRAATSRTGHRRSDDRR